MDFNYLGFVREVLAMNRLSDASAISTDHETDTYKVQLCVNDTIADLSNVLRIKSRQINFTITTSAATRTYVLPVMVQFPLISLRNKDNDKPLTQLSSKEFDVLVPDDDSSGDPSFYYLENYSGVLVQPTAETVGCVSSNSGDTGTIVIQGYDSSGNYIVEEVTLTGTSSVTSANTYSYIENISKPVTYGNITVTGSTSSSTIIILNARETVKRIPMIGLHPIPSTASTIYGRGYLQMPQLTYASEIPLGLDVRHKNAVILGASARFLRYVKDVTVETIDSAFNSYYTEVQKIVMGDMRDPDKLHRMKSATEQRVLNYFKPLDILTPW